eukprot:1184370-Prorocentrum_minimum.AAC.3
MGYKRGLSLKGRPLYIVYTPARDTFKRCDVCAKSLVNASLRNSLRSGQSDISFGAEVGSGAYSTVYRATCPKETGGCLDVAVKVLRRKVEGNEEKVLQREVEVGHVVPS